MTQSDLIVAELERIGVDRCAAESIASAGSAGEQWAALITGGDRMAPCAPAGEPDDSDEQRFKRCLPFDEAVVAAGYYLIHAVHHGSRVDPGVAATVIDPHDGVVLGDVLMLLGLKPREVAEVMCYVAAGRMAARDGDTALPRKTYEDTRPKALDVVGSVRQHPVYPWPPTGQTFQKRLGGGYYSDAVKSLGLVANARGRERGLIFYDQDDYVNSVVDFLAARTDEGGSTSYGAYCEWVLAQRDAGTRRPTGPAVRLHFKSWQRAKDTGLARLDS